MKNNLCESKQVFMKSKIILSIVVILLASLGCKTISNVNIPLSTATMTLMSPTNTANVTEQVWAQLIMVDTKDEAVQVFDRLSKGEDWNKIAAEVSTDTNTADIGGDLGWFGRGVMVKEFETVAFSLEVGAISQPVKTDFGYAIIRVLGHEFRSVNITATP